MCVGCFVCWLAVRSRDGPRNWYSGYREASLREVAYAVLSIL